MKKTLSSCIMGNVGLKVRMCVLVCSDAADDINRIASSLYTLGTQDSTDLCKYEQTRQHHNTLFVHMLTSLPVDPFQVLPESVGAV